MAKRRLLDARGESMDRPWHSLLEVARHAPSPLNAQPWRLRVVAEDRAELYIDRSRTVPQEELTGRYLVLTLGLFVESLRLVAGNHGSRLEDELAAANDSYEPDALDEKKDDELLFARLSLRAGGRPSDYPDELFLARRTSRMPYQHTAVSLEDARALAQIASSWGYRYTQTSNPERIERLLATSLKTTRDLWRQPGCREEFVRWIRFSDRDARQRGDGLDARCLGLQPFDLLAEYRLPESIHSMTRGPFVERERGRLGPVATMGVLSGAFREVKEIYRAGMFLMHFWLECTRKRLSIQPFANLVTDGEAAKRCERDWRVPDIWFSFRIGHSGEPAKSYRRAVDDFVRDETEEPEPTAAAPPTSPATSGRRS
jgi:nitroreductase